MNLGELTGLVAVTMIFGIPIVAVLTAHHRKLVEMKLQRGHNASDSVIGEIRQLREQMSELRDTTTKYDVSFDSALQRIESRVGGLEQRVTSIESESKNHVTSH